MFYSVKVFSKVLFPLCCKFSVTLRRGPPGKKMRQLCLELISYLVVYFGVHASNALRCMTSPNRCTESNCYKEDWLAVSKYFYNDIKGYGDQWRSYINDVDIHLSLSLSLRLYLSLSLSLVWINVSLF